MKIDLETIYENMHGEFYSSGEFNDDSSTLKGLHRTLKHIETVSSLTAYVMDKQKRHQIAHELSMIKSFIDELINEEQRKR